MQRIRSRFAGPFTLLALIGAIIAGSAASVSAQYADGYYGPNRYNTPHEQQWQYDRNMDSV